MVIPDCLIILNFYLFSPVSKGSKVGGEKNLHGNPSLGIYTIFLTFF